MDGFPFGIYSKYGSGNESNTAVNNTSNLDGKVNRICRNIAQTVIRSGNDDYDQDEVSTHFELPKIPKDVVIFGAIVLTKIALYVAYKAARNNHMEILDI